MTPERLEPRRRDRARDDAWIRGFLDRAPWGTLAVTPPEPGRPPHVNTNLFVAADDPVRIYLHTARTGALADAVDAAGPEGAPAVFTAAVMGRLLPAPEALEFSVEYAAVVARGALRRVADDGEAAEALHALLDRYAPHLERGRDYRAVVPDELRRTAVFRLDIEAWSGKQKAVGEHPGAFTVESPTLPVESGER